MSPLRMIGCFAAVALVASGCGRADTNTPASPSPTSSTPSLTPAGSASPQFRTLAIGRWFGGFEATVVNSATGQSDSLFGVKCGVDGWVTSQTGGQFSGSVGIQGNGANSDPLCLNSSAMSGDMTAGGTALSLRFDPVLRHGTCTHVSGDEQFTGAVTDGGRRISAQRVDRVSCRHPYTGVTIDGDRTTTVNLTPQ